MKGSMKVRPHTIQILVDPNNGDFVYLPAVYHATEKEQIRWIANGSWAIQFPNGTPLNEGVTLRGAPEVEVDSSVREGAKGVYHYAVAVEINGEVFLDAGCPTIVIG